MIQKPRGAIHYFRSRIDNELQPCAVCATDTGSQPKPLILEVSPGASAENIDRALELSEEIAGIAARKGESCVVLRPTGRGPGSIYQNYGEVDLFEALEHVCSVYPIDRDRITITGSSMGGAACWYLISHYPDVFAAAGIFCGYCDYRLWEKPGGLTFHMHPWEEPSWQSRSAVLLVENLEHTPVWMVHGEWDRSVGGGVSVEHSRQMAHLLAERGFQHKLTVVPKTGHGCRKPQIAEEVIGWLLKQKKRRAPRHVALATFSLRHNLSYWVRIEQLVEYGRRGLVDAEVDQAGRIVVRTENVRALSLGPTSPCAEPAVTIDGQELGSVSLDAPMGFLRGRDDAWTLGEPDATRQKRCGVSGPFGDLFHEGTVLVYGTTGTEAETFFTEFVAGSAPYFFSNRNGGVHRGGIQGKNSVELLVLADNELSEELLRERSLLLYGTPSSNAILKRFEGRIPIAFEKGMLRLAGKTYKAERAAAIAVFPHPENSRRYVAVHGGVSPDAITWGSHLDMMLLPDYLIYSGGELLDWGFWDNDWKV